jgi:hypothetical protein
MGRGDDLKMNVFAQRPQKARDDRPLPLRMEVAFNLVNQQYEGVVGLSLLESVLKNAFNAPVGGP